METLDFKTLRYLSRKGPTYRNSGPPIKPSHHWVMCITKVLMDNFANLI